jgi:hypothetical protein
MEREGVDPVLAPDFDRSILVSIIFVPYILYVSRPHEVFPEKWGISLSIGGNPHNLRNGFGLRQTSWEPLTLTRS